MLNLEHSICKFYNKKRELIYVATTKDFNKLLISIKNDKYWANEIDFVSKSEMVTTAIAKKYKIAYIISINPKYNSNKPLKFKNYRYKEGALG